MIFSICVLCSLGDKAFHVVSQLRKASKPVENIDSLVIMSHYECIMNSKPSPLHGKTEGIEEKPSPEEEEWDKEKENEYESSGQVDELNDIERCKRNRYAIHVGLYSEIILLASVTVISRPVQSYEQPDAEKT